MTVWELVVGQWTSDWTYCIYHDEESAQEALAKIPPKWGTPRIRRVET